MSFLTSLLSGLREIRAPLASGLLWVAVIYILVAPNVATLVVAGAATHAITEALGAWRSVIVPPLVMGSSYLLGTISQSIFAPILRLLGGLCRRSLLIIGSYRRSTKWVYSLISKFELRTWPLTPTSRGLIHDSIGSSLAKAGVPGSAALFFPTEGVINQLEITATQLSQTASVQYQEYERLQAESVLRLAIIPPLVALAITSPLHAKLIVVFIAIIATCVLGIQAASSIRVSQNLLANALYQGYIEIPIVNTVTATLVDLDPKPKSSGQWIGAIITAFWNLGFFDEAHTALDEVNSKDYENKWSDAKEYLDINCKELAGWWDEHQKQDT